MERRGIIVISSGTTDEKAIKMSIDVVENRIQNYFYDWEIRRAFTSEAIINKLIDKSNIKIDTGEEAILKMLKEGFTYVIVQPLHIIPGIEYEKTAELVRKYKSKFKDIKLGRPVLYYDRDIKEAVEALNNQIYSIKEDEVVVLVAHGTKHNANIYYKKLQEEIFRQGIKVYLVTLGEYPCIYDIMEKLKSNNIKNVVLVPYMLVCGEHGKKDICGEKEDSCRSLLEKEGFTVSLYLHGIGENERYQEIYIDHIKDVIEE